MVVNDSEINFNSVSIETAKVMNKIESHIELIKNKSGYGSVTIGIYDKKVSNIKATISEDLIIKIK
jgi:hypothetical protein